MKSSHYFVFCILNSLINIFVNIKIYIIRLSKKYRIDTTLVPDSCSFSKFLIPTLLTALALIVSRHCWEGHCTGYTGLSKWFWFRNCEFVIGCLIQILDSYCFMKLEQQYAGNRTPPNTLKAFSGWCGSKGWNPLCYHRFNELWGVFLNKIQLSSTS